MKIFGLAAVAAVALATPALGGDDVMASRYGNTTVVTTAQGTVVKIWYNPDHTVTWRVGQLMRQGTWKLDGGGNMCITLENPPGNMPATTCNPFEQHAVGESWSVGEGDQKLGVTIVAGHQD